jgi:hypothetical protein
MVENGERHSESFPDVTDDAILQVLNQNAFASVQELAKCISIPTTPGWRRLTRYLGFVVKHVHWVPYRFTDVQLQIPIDQSIKLVGLLESAQASDWQSFVTLDEF